jgi:hypothetical protein
LGQTAVDADPIPSTANGYRQLGQTMGRCRPNRHGAIDPVSIMYPPAKYVRNSVTRITRHTTNSIAMRNLGERGAAVTGGFGESAMIILVKFFSGLPVMLGDTGQSGNVGLRDLSVSDSSFIRTPPLRKF